jgi:hypothetical protein
MASWPVDLHAPECLSANDPGSAAQRSTMARGIPLMRRFANISSQRRLC